MYLDHFGLRELPFRLTPLTEFFFSGAKRGATVEALIYAVLHDEGIVKVSGEVGSGKTMLCRMLIERLPGQVDTVYFANPTLAPADVLRTIAQELGLNLAGDGASVLIDAIQRELIKRHGEGRRVVALIDEAHAMPRDSLEQIRLLSNLETGRHKLLQIVLFGQPELDSLLDTHPMRPLKDRITHHFRLDPFSVDEVTDYLEFRMRAAGFRGPTVFSPASARKIARYAAGLTRRINVLADKALLAAFAENLYAVNPAHVKIAARDAQYLPDRSRRPGWFFIPALLIISTFVGWEAFSHLSSQAPREPVAAARVSPEGTPSTAAPQETESTAAQTAPARAEVSDDASKASPSPVDTAAPAPVIAPTTEPDQRTALPAPSEAAAPSMVPSPVAAAEASLAAWLPGTDDQTWFIQLHTNTNASDDQLTAQVVEAMAQLDGAVRVYRAQLPAGERTGVITGDFRSERDAIDALSALPPAYRSGGAYVRQARHLK